MSYLAAIVSGTDESRGCVGRSGRRVVHSANARVGWDRPEVGGRVADTDFLSAADTRVQVLLQNKKNENEKQAHSFDVILVANENNRFYN